MKVVISHKLKFVLAIRTYARYIYTNYHQKSHIFIFILLFVKSKQAPQIFLGEFSLFICTLLKNKDLEKQSKNPMDLLNKISMEKSIGILLNKSIGFSHLVSRP